MNEAKSAFFLIIQIFFWLRIPLHCFFKQLHMHLNSAYIFWYLLEHFDPGASRKSLEIDNNAKPHDLTTTTNSWWLSISQVALLYCSKLTIQCHKCHTIFNLFRFCGVCVCHTVIVLFEFENISSYSSILGLKFVNLIH